MKVGKTRDIDVTPSKLKGYGGKQGGFIGHRKFKNRKESGCKYFPDCLECPSKFANICKYK